MTAYHRTLRVVERRERARSVTVGFGADNDPADNVIEERSMPPDVAAHFPLGAVCDLTLRPVSE